MISRRKVNKLGPVTMFLITLFSDLSVVDVFWDCSANKVSVNYLFFIIDEQVFFCPFEIILIFIFMSWQVKFFFSSSRFPGTLNVDLNELSMNLVPFPKLHFLLASQSPMMGSQSISGPRKYVNYIVMSQGSNLLGCLLLFYQARIWDKVMVICVNSMSTAIFNTAKRSPKTRE